MATTTKNNHAADRERIRQRIRTLEAERKEIEENTVERRLSRIHSAVMAAHEELRQLDNAESRIRHDSAKNKSQLERDCEAQIAANNTLERAVVIELGGLLPTRYLRADALEFFEKSYKEALSTYEKALAPFRARNDYQKPGGRILALKADADKLQAEHDHEKKYCVAGQRVFELREQRAKLQEQLNEMRLAREQAALKAAGFVD